MHEEVKKLYPNMDPPYLDSRVQKIFEEADEEVKKRQGQVKTDSSILWFLFRSKNPRPFKAVKRTVSERHERV